MDALEETIFTAVLITAIVLGTVFTYFVISILRQQRKNLALHKANILAEVTQIEKERQRMAQDLHDELGPVLSAIKMKISSFDLPDPDDQAQAVKTKEHIDWMLRRIREISFNLMPNSLLRKGLVSALREFFSFLNNNSGVRFHFEAERDLKVSEIIAVNIYRIVQEVVHNTIKHAAAKSLIVELKKENDTLTLFMRDDGKGFDHSRESEDNPGFGLKSLHRRTEIMNGKMYIESKTGSGTSYTFEIPAA